MTQPRPFTVLLPSLQTARPVARLVHQDSVGHFQAQGSTGADLSSLLVPAQAQQPKPENAGRGEHCRQGPGSLRALREDGEDSGRTQGGLRPWSGALGGFGEDLVDSQQHP